VRRGDALDDLALCEELALRVALALDNARLYQRAQEALAARDEFLALASHELRTPLTTLHLQVELLRRDLQESERGRQPIDPTRRSQLLSSMDRQTRRLVKLLKNLFDVSRIHAGRSSRARARSSCSPRSLCRKDSPARSRCHTSLLS
jgi:signal transduction histidine kinase